MFYPPEVVEEVRMGNDIVDVVSTYVALKQKGSNHIGLCPFHNEKTPSFTVSADKQIYHCFGCGAGGNVYSFVMQYENVSFAEALKLLADRIHFRLPERKQTAEWVNATRTKETIYNINKAAARFFYETLQQPEGQVASTYLDERGISPQMRVRFGLGAAPSESGLLHVHLLGLGYAEPDILASGLILEGKKGGYYGRFRDRLMFPIIDAAGRVAGFGGRVMGAGEPKYLNSPETPVFDKSRNLYGINFAKKSRTKTFILVEGYMDVIAMHQAGFANAVAALGTAFNDNHAILLKKYASEAIALFDSDKAGVNAALRAIPVMDKAGLAMKVLTLKGAKDPDEYLKAFGAQALAAELTRAKTATAFMLENLQSQHDLSGTEGKVNFTLEAAKILAGIESSVEKDAYITETAQLTGISRKAIDDEVDKLTRNKPGGAGTPLNVRAAFVPSAQRAEKARTEARKSLLGLLAAYPALCQAVKPHLEPEEMGGGVYTELLAMFYERAVAGDRIYPAEIINRFETEDEHRTVSGVFTLVSPIDDGQLKKAINDLVKNVKSIHEDERWAAEPDKCDEYAIQQHVEFIKNVNNLNISISDG